MRCCPSTALHGTSPSRGDYPVSRGGPVRECILSIEGKRALIWMAARGITPPWGGMQIAAVSSRHFAERPPKGRVHRHPSSESKRHRDREGRREAHEASSDTQEPPLLLSLLTR